MQCAVQRSFSYTAIFAKINICLSFVFQREVQKAVNNAQGLHQRWMELLQDPGGATKEEVDWTTNELRNSLRSIEWDLEDLDETINILSVQMCETRFCICVLYSFSLNLGCKYRRGQSKEVQPGRDGAGEEKSFHHEHKTNSQGTQTRVTREAEFIYRMSYWISCLTRNWKTAWQVQQAFRCQRGRPDRYI